MILKLLYDTHFDTMIYFFAASVALAVAVITPSKYNVYSSFSNQFLPCESMSILIITHTSRQGYTMILDCHY